MYRRETCQVAAASIVGASDTLAGVAAPLTGGLIGAGGSNERLLSSSSSPGAASDGGAHSDAVELPNLGVACMGGVCGSRPSHSSAAWGRSTSRVIETSTAPTVCLCHDC